MFCSLVCFLFQYYPEGGGQLKTAFHIPIQKVSIFSVFYYFPCYAQAYFFCVFQILIFRECSQLVPARRYHCSIQVICHRNLTIGRILPAVKIQQLLTFYITSTCCKRGGLFQFCSSWLLRTWWSLEDKRRSTLSPSISISTNLTRSQKVLPAIKAEDNIKWKRLQNMSQVNSLYIKESQVISSDV